MENQSMIKKERILEETRIKLKEKFFGIDLEIDQIIDGISSWYHFPDFQIRPSVINLWGMTGVGKSDLVRDLVNHLGVGKYFFDLDCGEIESTRLKSAMGGLEILKNPPAAVFLLDEFQLLENVKPGQRGRSIDPSRVIWKLLDDGKIIKSDFFSHNDEIVERIFIEVDLWVKKGLKIINGMVSPKFREFLELRGYLFDVPEGLEEFGMEPVTGSQFVFQRDELKALFNYYKLDFSSLSEFHSHVLTLNETGILKLVTEAWERSLKDDVFDFSRSLIFVVGNLDKAFSFAGDQTSDISPDEFYALSRRIKLPQIKKALKLLFRSEQISRLGNNHVIYPSLDEEAYRKVIDSELKKIQDSFLIKAKIPLEFDDSVSNWLFDEGVAATQGVRPLLSTIRYSLGDLIPKIMLGYFQHAPRAIRIKIFMKDGCDVEYHTEQKAYVKAWFPVQSKIKKLKKSRGDEFQAMVAVHEAGHAVLNFMTKGKLPKKIVSVSSDSDSEGFVYNGLSDDFITYDRLFKEVIVFFGGLVAEQLVFGAQNVSTGSAGDIEHITEQILYAFKECGFGSRAIRFAQNSCDRAYAIQKTQGIEEEAETFIQKALEEARQILKREEKLVVETAKKLLEKSQLESEEFRSLIEEFGTAELIHESGQNRKSFKEMLLERSEQVMLN